MFGSVVLQDTWLFSEVFTIRYDVGRLDARKDEIIIHAAKMANVHHFIRTCRTAIIP